MRESHISTETATGKDDGARLGGVYANWQSERCSAR